MTNETPQAEWTVEDEIEASLKPCPRCGSKAVLDDGCSDGIHCDGCGYWTGEDMDRDEAIDWWNKQPLIGNMQEQIAALTAERDRLQATVVVPSDVAATIREALEYRLGNGPDYEVFEAEGFEDTVNAALEWLAQAEGAGNDGTLQNS